MDDRPAILDYAEPKPSRISHALDRIIALTRRVFSRRNLKRATIILLVASAIATVLYWQYTRPRPWDVRLAKIDGADVVVGLGLRLYKFEVYVPRGNWQLDVTAAKFHRDGRVTTLGSTGSYPQPGWNPIYVDLGSEFDSDLRISTGASSNKLSLSNLVRDPDVGWGTSTRPEGRLVVGLPQVLLVKEWNDPQDEIPKRGVTMGLGNPTFNDNILQVCVSYTARGVAAAPQPAPRFAATQPSR